MCHLIDVHIVAMATDGCLAVLSQSATSLQDMDCSSGVAVMSPDCLAVLQRKDVHRDC